VGRSLGFVVKRRERNVFWRRGMRNLERGRECLIEIEMKDPENLANFSPISKSFATNDAKNRTPRLAPESKCALN
jgi:hypothetical protein